MTIIRTDIHRPSAIQPEEYQFVGIFYDPNAQDVVGGDMLLAAEREQIEQFMTEHGATWATHEHGGSCQCCGASALYLGVFYHEHHNVCIRVGQECAAKIGMGRESDFRYARERVRCAKAEAQRKAAITQWIDENGLAQAEELYRAHKRTSSESRDVNTVVDIMSKLHRFGSLSEKQISFARGLLQRINGGGQQAAEKAAAQDCPKGRIDVSGTVISTREVEGYWGTATKMLVRTLEGYTLWGTVPRGVKAERGAQVCFSATVEPAENDPKHGYFSRPKAKKA
jgi:hypothetical protein